MIYISAVIITFNEERNIARCLNSLKGIVDDIIIVDSFSTDKTKEICAAYPEVQFFLKKWEGYSTTKNKANQLARYDYILSLDADESLSDELKTYIKLLKKRYYHHDAYSFNRLTNYCRKWIYHSGWYPDEHIRLWNRKKAKWKGVIHETLCFENTVFRKHIPLNILHYSYYNFKEHILTASKFSEISARDLIKNQKKVGFSKLLLSPLWRFISIFFFKKGFKDGFYGLFIAITSAYAGFLKYALAIYFQKNSIKNR